MSKVFLDTNILVYGFDAKDPIKRDACRGLVEKVRRDGNGVISTQVLQEFYVTATTKFGADPLAVKELVSSFADFAIVTNTVGVIQSAIDCQVLFRISFWDALIIAAAESARCDRVWTEDMNPGQVIRGVRIENPLKGR